MLQLPLLPQVSVEGEHHEKAVELLKAAPASVKLVVRYTPKVGRAGEQHLEVFAGVFIPALRTTNVKVLEEMEMRFDKQRQARRRQVYS